MTPNGKQLYLDLDDVLADFKEGYSRFFGEDLIEDGKGEYINKRPWSKVSTQEAARFFLDMPIMRDARVLWDYCYRYDPWILTGAPADRPEVGYSKRQWVQMHFGREVTTIVTQSKNKFLYCAPGDILVDDWEKFKKRWLKAGGVWITHLSADDSIRQLQELGL